MYNENELSELFKRLFYNFDGIIICRFRQGLSGTKIVKVIPRGGASVIVKYGDRGKIRDEASNFNKYVLGCMGDFKSTYIMRHSYTDNIGGIIYTLIGAPLSANCIEPDPVTDFYDYYDRNPGKDIIGVINEIFTVIFNPWYGNSIKSGMGIDLYKEYDRYLNIDRDNLANEIFGINVPPPQNIKFHNQLFENPVECIRNKNWTDFFSICPTHGDLHGNNILVDNSHHPWIIDFGRTGKGHILRDFTELETSIKFGVINTNGKTEEELFRFEQALYPSVQSLQFSDIENITFNGAGDLAKAFGVIKGLRGIAVRVVGNRCDYREYYIGILYNTLKMLSIPNLSIDKKYALKSAAMLCDKL